MAGADTPVLLIVFSRLDEVTRVLTAIREASPRRLYVAADGPRPQVPGETEACRAVLDHVRDNVDWPCEVRTLIRDENMGPRLAISEAITWFFEHETEGIILEEDCLPGNQFFGFCSELLERYRDDDRVMHIGGSCQLERVDCDDSYFFSRYARVWGWATWRRAWDHYRVEIDLDADLDRIGAVFTLPEERDYWSRLLRRYAAGEIETWDYPWAVAIWKRRGLSAYPVVDLTKNIGITSGALHTAPWKDHRNRAGIEIRTLDRITHPATVEENDELDRRVFRECYERPGPPTLLFRLAKRALGR